MRLEEDFWQQFYSKNDLNKLKSMLLKLFVPTGSDPGTAAPLLECGPSMARGRHSFSLFDQALDRASAVVYFLGAVVPFGALGWLVLQWARPRGFDARADWFIAVLGLIGGLTLLSFFALRRLTRRAVRTIARENDLRARMLSVSRSLASAADADEVLRLAAEAMAELVGATHGAVFAREASGELAPRDRGRLAAEQNPRLAELQAVAVEAEAVAAPAVRAGRPATNGCAVAVPCLSAASSPVVLAAWVRGPHEPTEAEREALATLGSFTAVALANADLRAAERNFFAHVTNLLVAALDRYLDDRSDHSRRVAAVANQISRRLELPEPRRERLHFAALLHDIGMLQIPRAHADDRVLARRHVELGDEMLRPIRMWEDLAAYVRHHHERWDGGGYPDGLRGEEIPLESRIIAVAEAFDVMTAEKSYKEAIPVAEALARLVDAAGEQFDPRVVEALVKARQEPA